MIREESRDPGMAPILCKVLLYCVLIAVALFIMGLVYLSVSSSTTEINEQLSLQEMGDAIASASPEGILGIGITIVVVTPLIRLLTTTVLSLKIRDRIVALFTIFSFLAIMIAFLLKTFTF